MSRAYPSMTALLGLLAMAGYQNKDKIAEILAALERTRPQQATKAASAVCSASLPEASVARVRAAF